MSRVIFTRQENPYLASGEICVRGIYRRPPWETFQSGGGRAYINARSNLLFFSLNRSVWELIVFGQSGAMSIKCYFVFAIGKEMSRWLISTSSVSKFRCASRPKNTYNSEIFCIFFRNDAAITARKSQNFIKKYSKIPSTDFLNKLNLV